MQRARGNRDVWVAMEYGISIFLRLVIIFALLWAVVGSFSYGYLLEHFGLNRMSIELKWSLFVGLSLLVVTIAAVVSIGATQVVFRIYRSFQRN
jgi:hypothetical protein